jgi:hypothetical protein
MIEVKAPGYASWSRGATPSDPREEFVVTGWAEVDSISPSSPLDGSTITVSVSVGPTVPSDRKISLFLIQKSHQEIGSMTFPTGASSTTKSLTLPDLSLKSDRQEEIAPLRDGSTPPLNLITRAGSKLEAYHPIGRSLEIQAMPPVVTAKIMIGLNEDICANYSQSVTNGLINTTLRGTKLSNSHSVDIKVQRSGNLPLGEANFGAVLVKAGSSASINFESTDLLNHWSAFIVDANPYDGVDDTDCSSTPAALNFTLEYEQP